MSERYRLLHVEDDKDWQKRLRSILSDKCDITSCASIEEALRLLETGKRFDIAAVDLTIDRSGSEWEITTPEELVLYLKEQGIGVAVFSGVAAFLKPKIEVALGVKVVDKSTVDFEMQEIITAALLGYSDFQE